MSRVSQACLLLLALLCFNTKAEQPDKDDLPICHFVDNWFRYWRCYDPLEQLHCVSDVPLCRCGSKQICSAKAVHSTQTSGEVPCHYMCKSIAKAKVEKKNIDRYNMGLLIP